MQVQVKLMGALRGKLPPGSQGGKASVEVSSPCTVDGLLQHLGVGPGQAHLVMVNGDMAHERTRELAEGDEVVVFPPVAGGA